MELNIVHNSIEYNILLAKVEFCIQDNNPSLYILYQQVCTMPSERVDSTDKPVLVA